METFVVSDGKKGHLNQSLAFAELLGGSTSVLEVRPLRGLSEPLTRIFSGLLSPRCYPAGWRSRILRSCFGVSEPVERKRLAADSKPLVISAGTTTAVPALALAGLIGARTLHILGPSLVPSRLFDAVIRPLHDVRGRVGRNVLTLPIALGPSGGQALAHSLSVMRDRLGLEENPPGGFLALLIGGDSAHHEMRSQPVLTCVAQAISLAREHDLRVLLTTSRRTPGVLEEGLRALAMAEADICYCSVWGRTDAYNPVPAFLELARAVVVTEDSISMISEAILAGHRPLIFRLPPRGTGGKLVRFYRYLRDQDLAAFMDADVSGEEVWEASFACPRRSRQEVYNAIGFPELLTRARELLGF